ncbi:hypothetical protein LCGC14_0898560 [marine sediment metagenome]|uniref:Uncharacterized protein n=1 Tax=marine sediment metagenome TaxID=412755 RepID=A0A0F9NX29_9ZZZZ
MPKTTTRRKKVARKSTRKKTPAGHKKVILTCEDRIFLLEVLPARESHVALRLMRKMRERISLSEAEIKQIDFQTSFDGRVSGWKRPGKAKGFTFSPFELETIKGGLKKKDDEKDLAEGHLKLWDAFMPKDDEEE